MGYRICVFGTARSREGDSDYDEAWRLGRHLAEAGYDVCTGGYAGAMEAVSRGAHEAGGHVVGVTVSQWTSWLTPNSYLKEEIATANLYSRLEQLISSDALIAVHGGAGTLAEVALAWNMLQFGDTNARALILVGPAWRLLAETFAATLVVNQKDLSLLRVVDTPEEAVAILPGLLQQPPSAGYRSDPSVIRG